MKFNYNFHLLSFDRFDKNDRKNSSKYGELQKTAQKFLNCVCSKKKYKSFGFKTCKTFN